MLKDLFSRLVGQLKPVKATVNILDRSCIIIDGCESIVQLDNDIVCIQCSDFKIEISGEQLSLNYYSGDSVNIVGKIYWVGYS